MRLISHLKAVRESKGLTIDQLSQATMVKPATIRFLEYPYPKANPFFITISLLAHYLDTPVGELFEVSMGSIKLDSDKLTELGEYLVTEYGDLGNYYTREGLAKYPESTVKYQLMQALGFNPDNPPH